MHVQAPVAENKGLVAEKTKEEKQRGTKEFSCTNNKVEL